MKKLLAFSIVPLLVLSGCGNQPATPTGVQSIPTQVVISIPESTNKPYFPKETVIEEVPELPTGEPLATPESEPSETETVPAPQTETRTKVPLEPQYEAESPPPATVAEKSPDPSISEETPAQALPVPPDTQPDTEPTTPQPVPPEFSSEPEIQEPTESVDDCITYGMEYAVSIGLVLDNTAIDCWDTPITSSVPYYIKRDITSRLNRYKDHEDVSDIWIWKESVGNGRYEIYIGYA